MKMKEKEQKPLKERLIIMKKPIIISIIILIVAIPAVPYVAGNLYFSTARVIEMNWGVSVPDGFEEIYHVKTPASFHGDGERYTVFEAKGGAAPGIGAFSNGRDAAAEMFVNAIMNNLEVPENKRPDTSDYRWKSYSKSPQEEDGSSMIVIYTPENKRMYFVERHL